MQEVSFGSDKDMESIETVNGNDSALSNGLLAKKTDISIATKDYFKNLVSVEDGTEKNDAHLNNISQLSKVSDVNECKNSEFIKHKEGMVNKETVKTNEIGTPRSTLAKFIPSSPILLNNSRINLTCDNKIIVSVFQSLKEDKCNLFDKSQIQISVSHEDDEFEGKEQAFSRSYDCNEEYNRTIHDTGPTMSRSLSEDILQRSSSRNFRRVSVASTKGKLLGCPRVMPGEKIVRSVSLGGHTPSKPPPEILSESLQSEKKTKFTTQQKLVAFCLCLVDFTSFLSMSIIAPFFPREAAAKGMREAVSGFVFSIYALVVVLTSPLFGKLLPIVGARFMFLSGVFFCGVCNILFGLLDNVDGEVEFAVLCFVVRSFEALGAAAFCTASCTILIDQFPDDIGTVFGFTETCIGIGMSIGPAIGGALYSVGGFGLPFFTLGIFVVLTVPVCWYLMRHIQDPEVELNSGVSYKKLLTMPHVVVVCIILVVASQAQGFIDPTLEPHMRQYNLDTGIIGLLFLLLSGAYAIGSPIVGWISGKMENKYPIMIGGLLLVTIALLLIGPSEILPFEGSLALSIVALMLLGVSFAAAYVPTFESMFEAAMNGGLEDDITTYSVVSGLWNSMYSLGEVTGPSLGGILSDFFTFPEASTLMAFCALAAFIIAILAWTNPCNCFGPVVKTTEERSQSCSSERTFLQQGNTSNYGSVSESNPIV